MPVVLRNQKSAVIEALRAARNVDDEFSRLRSNSWEEHQIRLSKLVESRDWRHGPAELLATFPHHVLVRAPFGALLRVEWKINPTDSSYELGRVTLFEVATPASDLGRELMETAKTAVDLILDERIEEVQPMISTMAEALDAGGSLQNRIVSELTLQTLQRKAWWHAIVGEREKIEELLPEPTVEGENALQNSIEKLLNVLKEAARDMIAAVRKLDAIKLDPGIEAVVKDIAEDVRFAIKVLAEQENNEEALNIYETVMSAAPRLFNGIAFIIETAQARSDDHASSP